MTSVNTLGSTSITLQFDLDRDITGAARDVQAAINASLSELPPNLPSLPNYRKVNPADSPILILSLTSKSLQLAQVFDAANSVLAQKISQIDGVGQVFVGGGNSRRCASRSTRRRWPATGCPWKTSARRSPPRRRTSRRGR